MLEQNYVFLKRNGVDKMRLSTPNKKTINFLKFSINFYYGIFLISSKTYSWHHKAVFGLKDS